MKNVLLIIVVSLFIGCGISSPQKTTATQDLKENNDTFLIINFAENINRFDTSQNGVVKDNSTGLTWLIHPESPELMSWYDLKIYINQLNEDKSGANQGFTDWRLPTIREIRSLINYSEPNTAAWLDERGFSFSEASYWSSTSYALDAKKAWIGLYTNAHRPQCSPKNNANYLLPVRGSSMMPKPGPQPMAEGISWPEPRFNETSENTITDLMTGLIWEKSPVMTNAMDWESAKGISEKYNREEIKNNSEFNDWRLPTIYELETLTNYDVSNANDWLTDSGFQNIKSQYWTKTPSLAGYGWTLLIFNGLISHNHKDLDNYVWLVRG